MIRHPAVSIRITDNNPLADLDNLFVASRPVTLNLGLIS